MFVCLFVRVVLLMCSFVRLFEYAFIRSFVDLFVCLIVCLKGPCIRLFVYSFVRMFVCSYVRMFACSFVRFRVFVCSLI